MHVGVALEKRGGTLWTSRAVHHRLHRRGLERAVGHDQNMPRGENGFQAHRHALRWSLIATEPFSIRFDGNGFKLEQSPSRILRAAGFVEAQMSILTQAKNHDIQSPNGSDLVFVLAHAGQRIFLQ